MAGREIGKLMTGLAKAKIAQDVAGQQSFKATLGAVLAETVHARMHRARRRSGNDNTA